MKVTQCGTTVAQYEYIAADLRTKKVANGRTELYYYEGGRLAQITDGGNSLKFFFTRDAAGSLLNLIDYTSASPVTYTYVFDAHGNVVGLADKNGTISVTYVYDAWGNITGGLNGGIFTGDGQVLRDANPFRYAAYQYDAETGFYYLKSRYYSPSLGRFLTRDVVPSHNLYAYCDGDPVNRIDPSGYYWMYETEWINGNEVENPNRRYWVDEIATEQNTSAVELLYETSLFAGVLVAATFLVSQPFVQKQAAKASATATAIGAAASSGYKAPEGGGGVTSIIEVGATKITFGHGGRHIPGIDIAKVSQAIANDVVQKVLTLGKLEKGTVVIDGTTIMYHAYQRAAGLIGIGTYYPLEK